MRSALAKRILPALLPLALAMGAGSASAQVAVYADDDDVDATVTYYDDPYTPPPVAVAPARPGPRVYGYVSSRPFGRNGCGTYHFWNGERCVDARDR